MTDIATFAGGCFWCTEAIFKRIKGVLTVSSGYTGGKVDNPTYSQVSTGKTGHAEAVQIEFNPDVISYERLLDIFWHLHDPTTLNQQGADIGTQYRSAIYFHNEMQKIAAFKSQEQIVKSKELKGDIVTEIKPFTSFYKAEDYHQNFFENNPVYPYCTLIINPKIQKLIELYNKDIKKEYLT